MSSQSNKTPWVVQKSRDAWIKEAYERNPVTLLDNTSKAVDAAKAQNNALKALNLILYICIVTAGFIFVFFLFSAVFKMEAVHFKKIFYAIILIILVQVLGKLLKVNM